MEILQLLGVAVGLASLAGLNLYLTVFLTGLAVRFAVALIALAAVAIGAAKPAVGAPFDHEKLAETARAAYIVPGYARFAEALAALERTTKALCQAPSPDNLAAIRAAYRGAIVAWGRVEIIMFGPVRDENRFERIFVWPDRSSLECGRLGDIHLHCGQRG